MRRILINALAVATLFALAVDWAIAATSSAAGYKWPIVFLFLSQSVILGQFAAARALSTGGRFLRAAASAACFALPPLVYLAWLFVRPERGGVAAMSIAAGATLICATCVTSANVAISRATVRKPL